MTWVRVMVETRRLKKTMPSSRAKMVAVGVAEHAGAVGDVDFAVEDGLDQALHLRRQVLAVGVERDHDLGPGVDHQPVAGAQRRTAAAVDHVAGDDRAVLGGDVAGAVARAVVDDEHLGPHAADLGRHPLEHVADVLGLVIGGDDDRDLAAEALGQLRLAELLPGEALEHGRELAGVASGLREGPQDQQEEDEDREDGEAEDAAAVALLKGEGGEQRVGKFGAGDDRQPQPARQQDQHVDVAQGATAQDREGDDRGRDDQAGGAERGQLWGEDACLEDHRAAGGYGRTGPGQGRAGKRKDECHQDLVATRGRQRRGADRGDEDDRGRHRDQLPPAATRREHGEPADREQHDQHLHDPAGGGVHRFADPAAPHPPHLAGGHRRVAERVFAEVSWRSCLCRSCRAPRRAAAPGSGRRRDRRGASDRPGRAPRSPARGRGPGSAWPGAPWPAGTRRRRAAGCRHRAPCRRRLRSARGGRGRQRCGRSRGRSAAAVPRGTAQSRHHPDASPAHDQLGSPQAPRRRSRPANTPAGSLPWLRTGGQGPATGARGSCRGGPPPCARTPLRGALRYGGPPPPRHPREERSSPMPRGTREPPRAG